MTMMSGSSLKFGTSGLRGLAVELEGQAARQYTAAFLRHVTSLDHHHGRRVFLGRDFRPSSPAVMRDCAAAVVAAGLVPVDCGTLPTPALALHAMAAGCPAIMVTGSHIPADRNGLKFYLPAGEISKSDEAGIVAALRDETVAALSQDVGDEAQAATERYFERFAGLLPEGALAGMRIGVFEHSTVARDLLTRILQHFGAETVSLGRVDGFVPIDTEAFGDAVFAPLPGWIREHKLDALVSADGDGDRPLLMDGNGAFVRGDVLGLLTARYCGAQSLVTPVTSNSAIEKTKWFSRVTRTKVGSPYVVAAMEDAPGAVIGFEANGGTFVGKGVSAGGKSMSALPTRDAILPVLCVLALAAGKGIAVGALVESLPLQHAVADRLRDVPGERSGAFLTRLAEDQDYSAGFFAPRLVESLSQIDGLQFWLASGEMVHFRASGNAPELRCYVEAGTAGAARELLEWGMKAAAGAVG